MVTSSNVGPSIPRVLHFRTGATTPLVGMVCCASLPMIVDAFADMLAHVDMTSAEADQRIIHSQRFLAGWIAVGAGGKIDEVLRIVGKEILILETLADEHPGKVDKIIALVTKWIDFQERLKKQFN